MQSRQSESICATAGLSTRHLRNIATKIGLGMLATTLIVGTAIPAFAGKPDQEHRGGRHEQKQEQEEVNAAGKRRGSRIKTVTRSFSNAEFIVIPIDGLAFGAAAPYPSPISVSGFKKATIVDVNLTLRDFNHTFPADVDVLLVAPGSRNAVVMANVGDPPGIGDAVTGLTLTLDDEANAAPPADEQLTSGTFRPFLNGDPALLDFPAPAPTPSGNETLSTFDGINPNGEWQLFIIDDQQGDTGRLANGWTLEISAKSKVKKKNKNKRRR